MSITNTGDIANHIFVLLTLTPNANICAKNEPTVNYIRFDEGYKLTVFLISQFHLMYSCILSKVTSTWHHLSFHFIEHRSERYIIVECQLESEIVLPSGNLEVSGQ